ncbi:unnamed protein product [Peniophora sp. CBMAI 1063]|nr:unnamed protein product [Peniophora sp. CBMAI 1063]
MSAHHRPLKAISVGLAILSLVNIIFAIWLWTSEPEVHVYTYEDSDYPEFWPLPPSLPVTLVVEETIHYPIVGENAQDEWASTASAGFGYLRLGPNYRAFALSMFHQLHCLRLMRSALAPGDYRPSTEGHFKHCLNYFRQVILCDPDLTLEPADVLEQDAKVERVSSVHVCKDWRQVYDAMSVNWDEWVAHREAFVNSSVETDVPGII